MSHRLFALFALAPVGAWAQGVEFVKANYTKYEYRIAMRDGKKLFTSVYLPKDSSRTYPILLNRTPYSVGPYGADKYKTDLGPSPLFAREGYIVVYQDVRGRYMSEGEFVNMRPHRAAKGTGDFDESTDTYDTIDWLVKNLPGHNGRVGTWGISYPGFYTAAGMIDAHPAHVAASPQAPIVDWFTGDDFHRNGALYLPHAFNFLAAFGKPRPEPTTKVAPAFEHGTNDGYAFFLRMGPLANADEKFLKNQVAFWNDMMKHPNYDEFWQSRNLRPHLKAIRPAVLTVGGWWDAENIYGALQVYRHVERSSPGAVNLLVMGPWVHGGWSRGEGDRLANVSFHAKTAEFYREQIEFPFFERHLKGKTGVDLPEAYVFETGTNVWRRHGQWPPVGTVARELYLQPKGGLGFAAPAEDGSDEFPSDPAKPVPYTGQVSPRMTQEYMVADQRFAAARPDVLVYQTEVLEEDLTLAGPVTPVLHVATTGTDADWIVKLIDVYPDDYPDPAPNPAEVRMGGYQQLVRGEVFRGRYRNSFEKPEAFVPGRAAKVEYGMNDVFHTFRRGHRVMVQIQSSWFPLVDRNPQKFVEINTAREGDFARAQHSVYRTRALPSLVRVGVLSGRP
ncbi:MAG: CocE/NonD family hydrolase [Acidobacteria bacterium]|nr:CocE/NonD family hydrolase [Acidobacteriota bacterium]